MAHDPFYYHLHAALTHFWAALHELNVARALPAYKLLSPSDQQNLRVGHHYWAKKIRAISGILPPPVDAAFVLDVVRRWIDGDPEKRPQLLDTTKSDNAEPPRPE